ncbi:septal ring lytic transglycosylase RlpA family protein [Flavobacterium sp. CBA20B-1]|uniref:Probable endolytic peptidoglycan transglycosylase RlpA n=1 Tax=Paenimyroides aestuarii TaxID=2968490 RepID=A0ABY5NUM0_9FLAO|nr:MULTISPECIES: septal ring lytic transglycosylase RlpA family protein [Flavobacteriaceae]UUV22144.1 septal ring lytic transglycosylase RlpA family protein [Paenimyroides aestuarii]WCM41431.1 septal ring lytic transglycosylase RlpA family protein [Flavobacterium sp. CBA20B-1]
MKKHFSLILVGLVTLTAIMSYGVLSKNTETDNNEKVVGKELAFAEVATANSLGKDSSKINEKEADLKSELVKLNAELEALEEEVEVVHEETNASYYHDKFNGRKTASGAIFSNKKYTAAHKTLPFGTKVRVTNLRNDREIIVEINDRGPFVKGRKLDLSKTAFMDLASNKGRGVLPVKIEVLPENYEERKSELQEELSIITSIPEDLDLNEFAL